MTELERAIGALKAAVKQSRIDKRVGDVVSQFTSYLILLKSSSPSSQSISKLRSILSRPLVPLYAAVPGPALQLSSAVLRIVIDDKLRNALNSQNIQLSAWWNEVAVALLSGVLDFLDKHNDDMTKETVASAFYPTICTLFFYQDTSLTLLPQTQRNAYSLLHETLSGHPGNQRRLRDHAVLGGSLIGIAISQSKDYLVIEALLDIVGWLIPITNKTETGTAKRTEFINDLFGSKEHFSCSPELVNIVQYISSSHWEDTVIKIMDALARNDITFPQSFALDEVDACGKCYLQPTAFDRLHLDRESFLVNVVEQDDVCARLMIPYGHIRSVTINVLKASPQSKIIVHADLTTPPSIKDVSLDIPAGQELYLKFEIHREDLSRLMEALRRRGVVKLSFLGENPQKQANKRRSVGLAHSIRLSGDSSPPPQGSQYEDKVQHVENRKVPGFSFISILTLELTVYKTNFPDDALSTTAYSKQESLPAQQMLPQTPAEKHEVQEFKNHASAACAPKSVPKPRPVSKSARKAAPLQVAPSCKSPAKDDPPSALHASVFGKSDDELSEISDDELPQPVAHACLIVRPTRNVKAEAAPSLSAKSNSFQPAPPTKRIAKRRLIVDSDEEDMQAMPGAAQRAPVLPAKPDMTVTTELSKIRHIEENVLLEIERPRTPTSKEANHPGPTDNFVKIHLDDDTVLKDASAYDQVPPCEAIPDAEFTAHGFIPTSPMKKNMATGNIPTKLAGIRRKWDDANSPTRAPKVLEDDHPPKKKARNTTSGDIPVKRAASTLPNPSELSTLSTTAAKAPRKYGKKGRTLLPVPSENVDFDEVPGVPSKGKASASAKADSTLKPVPKKVPAPNSSRQTRAGAMRRRNKQSPPEFESLKDVNPKLQPAEADTEIVAAPKRVDQITKAEPLHNDATNGPLASLKLESALRKQVDKTDMDRAGISTIAPRQLTKTKTEGSQAVITERKLLTPERARTPKPNRAPWESPVFIAQHAPTDKVKHLEVSPPDEDPLEPIQDVTLGEVDEAFFDDFIDYSVSLKGSEDPILPASDSPPLQLTPRKPLICIDLTLDPTPVKNCPGSTKGRGVAKDYRILPSKGPHPVESFKVPAAVPAVLHVTGRQGRHGTDIEVSKSSPDVAMDVIMSSLPNVPSNNEERREQLAASNIAPTPVGTNDVEGSLVEPRGMKSSPSVPVRRRQSIPTMASSKSNVRSNNHGAFGNSILETNTRPPKELILDRVISLISDDEFESSHPAQRLSSNRVRFENVGLPCSLSPPTLKTSVRPVKQMPVQNPKEQRAKKSPRDIKSDESNDIQDIVDVLSDIQTVIVKGIANKFKNVNKEVRAGREELLHDAAEDLHALADAYATQYNSFIVLEESYSKHRATMTRHWEGLIKSSEQLQDDLKKVLQKHDRNISSKTFPISLLPPNSRFSKH